MNPINTIIEELKNGQLFLAPTQHGVVSISGPDSRDFLQRLSTANFSGMESGSRYSCFVNNKGRIIDLVLVIAHNYHDFSLVSSFSQGDELLSWLESFHFIENFLLSLSPQLARTIISKSNSVDFKLDFKIELDRRPDLATLDQASFETLRIAALIPGLPELNQQLMPHNIGLGHLVSPDKGCYLGQEVLAKALTYQKHPKFLAGFKLKEKDYQRALPGDRISDFQDFSGFICSLAPIYQENLPNGLAIIEKTEELRVYNLKAQFIFR